MFYSIRSRIGALYILLILGVLLGLSIYLVNFVERNLLLELEARLVQNAKLTGDFIASAYVQSSDSDEIDRLAKHWASLLSARVTIIEKDGDVLGESHEDRKAMENHASRPEIVQANLTGRGIATRFSETVGYEMMYVAVPIESDGQVIGFSRIALPLNEVHARVRDLQRTLIGASLLATALAIALAIWVSNRITRPLRELISAANQMAAGKLKIRLIPSARDEIGRLTETFNEMAAQLNAQIDDLETERSRNEAVLNGMTDGLIIIDAENRIQLVNPAASAIFELEGPEAQGRSLFEIVRHHQIEEVLTLSRATGKSQSVTLEFTPRRLFLVATATPLGSVLPGTTMVLLQNLTRVRRLETVRQDFISNVSHELRTPLAALKALTETLQDSALDDPPAARRFLERMETELDSLSQMVEELLELSKIESGRVPLRQIPTSPRRLIDSAVERLGMQAERAGLEITIDCPEDLPHVAADPLRLAQVISNLLHNAIKFTPGGGRIEIAARIQKGNIQFSIKDSGVGILPDDLPRIFERFYKADRARSSGGTGLGLAIARHLVEAHGGVIWAESMSGEGSTFFFTIPIAELPLSTSQV